MTKSITAVAIVLFGVVGSIEAQNTGIGTTSPTEKLHVAGNIRADTVKPAAIKLVSNSGTGKVLTSDAEGNASRRASTSTGGVGFGTWGDCAAYGNISEYHPVADDGPAAQGYGISVAVSGDFAIIGSRYDDVLSSDQGSASIFQFDGTNWVFMQKLIDSTPAGDGYGSCVTIAGNFAVVGAPNYNFGQGGVYVYQYNGESWTLLQELADDTPTFNEDFGASIALSGNYLIIGAPREDLSFSDQGSASVYQFDGSNWVFMEKLTDATGAGSDLFGFSVAISGNDAMIGAYADDIGANGNQGSVSLYRYNGSNWVYTQRLLNGIADDMFGFSLAMSGSYLIAGAPGDDIAANNNQGSAYIYKVQGSSWSFVQNINDVNGGAGDNFGNHVSLSGSYALVAANQDDIGANNNQDSSSIWLRIGAGWSRLQYISDPFGKADDRFGESVSIDNSTKRFVIGSIGPSGFGGRAVFGKIN